MTSKLAEIFGDLGHILGVCPCEGCGRLFYLSEARPYLRGKQPRSVVDKLRADEIRLDNAEEKLAELERELRENAAQAGLRLTKRILRKIDPVFSGAGYDPQDVKVIFDPVTYVVFDGMSDGDVHEITLLASPPHNSAAERIQNSIAHAVKAGNLEFRTLRVDDRGKVESN